MKIRKNADRVEELINTLARARKQQTEAAHRLEQAQEELTRYMSANQRKTLTSEDGGKVYRVTFVQNVTTKINEASLKKAIGSSSWNKLTTAKLDRKKLSEAMDTGELDPYVVGMHVTEVPSKPFIRFTEGAKEEDGQP